MAKVIVPAGDHVIVLENFGHETVIDGITMPENERQQEMAFGCVVFKGPKAFYTEVQDLVMFGPYAGKNAVIDGVQYRIMREGQIEAYLKEKAERASVPFPSVEE